MDDLLRKLQLTELEILKVIDKICKKNQINYSLCGGTLLGAIRHKGFIPWDDDLDIAMQRDEYERFLTIWDELQPKGYILQTKENTPTFSQSFAKIRKDNTTFLQFEYEAGLYHTGVFVDIFPIDRIPNGMIAKKIFLCRCAKYLIYIRRNDHSLKNRLFARLSYLIYKYSNESSRKKYCDKFVESLVRNNKNKDWNCISVATVPSIKKEYLSTLCDEYTEIKFENVTFKCFKEWDNYLSVLYGEYMKLPAEKNRIWTHHPIIIDFDHNYEDLDCTKK